MIASSEVSIVNVAIAGGSGRIGLAVVDALVASGRFRVTVLSRSEEQGEALRHTIHKVVDYDKRDSLQWALYGQDALVCTLSRNAVPLQIALIDAAVTAGVKRIIPSEFGGNLQNPNSRMLPNYRHKAMVEHYLENIARRTAVTYTYIYTNALLDWSVEAGVLLDLKHAHVCLYDGGERAVSMCTVAGAAQAVVGVLSRYEETKNRAVYVQQALLSQRQLLEYAKQVTPGRPWTEVHVDLSPGNETASRSITTAGVGVFHVGAMMSCFHPDFGNRFESLDNDLLGVPALSDAAIKSLMRDIAD